MKETLLKKVNCVKENRADLGVRLCRGFGALLIVVSYLLKDSAIYGESILVSRATDIAQGMAIGLLLVGLIMSSKYGDKIRDTRKVFLHKLNREAKQGRS